MEITPVYLKGENAARVLTGAVIMLRSTVRMGRQLQNLSSRGRRRIQPDYCGEPEDASCDRPGAQAGKSYGAAADYRGYRYGEKICWRMLCTWPARVRQNRIWR